MRWQFAVSVHIENENCSMRVIYVCLWPVACGVWNHVNMYVACFLCLQFMHMHPQVALFSCAYRKVTVTQSIAARPPSASASPSSVLSGRHVLGWAFPTPRNPWPARNLNLAFWTRAPRSTPSPPSSTLRLVHVMFLWCVCLLVMVVCMCVFLRVVFAIRNGLSAFTPGRMTKYCCIAPV